MTKGKAVLLWGARSQARIVEALLRREGVENLVLFDHSLTAPDFPTRSCFVSRPEDLRRLLPDCAEAVVCIGGRHGAQRAALSEALRDRFGLAPRSIISPLAAVDPEADLGAGVQILMGACIGLAARIGAFSIVNSNATVDHECRLGSGVHVMGGAAVAGRVIIGDHATLGTNSTVLPDVTIGAGAQVGAGALVRHDVGADVVVVGLPAHRLRTEPPVVDLSVLNAI
jgi:sugar O-acyltransferase (sialic acid O-acetyltransferase NeuD family)